MNPGQTLAPLAEVVASRVLLDAVETSRRLTELGVPHALIGGLAVGIHGHPRATKDVDFLVGDLAFERVAPILVFRDELRDLVRVGVIDLMPIPAELSELADALRVPAAGEIPVIGPEALTLLKLRANRPQDRADLIALINSGLDIGAVTTYLKRHSPDLVPRFGEWVEASTAA
jgi:hypothetical protein